MKKPAIILFSALCLFACQSPPLERKLTDDNKIKVLTEIFNSPEISQEDKVALNTAISGAVYDSKGEPFDFISASESERQAAAGHIAGGKTAKEMIAEYNKIAAESQREMEAQIAETQKQELAAAARKDLLKKALDLKLLNKKLANANEYQKAMQFSLGYTNHSGKEISGAKGKLHFADQFGDKIATLELKLQSNIPKDTEGTVEPQWHYNQFMDWNNTLMNTPIEKLKMTWEPEVINYSDGTKLE